MRTRSRAVFFPRACCLVTAAASASATARWRRSRSATLSAVVGGATRVGAAGCSAGGADGWPADGTEGWPADGAEGGAARSLSRSPGNSEEDVTPSSLTVAARHIVEDCARIAGGRVVGNAQLSCVVVCAARSPVSYRNWLWKP